MPLILHIILHLVLIFIPFLVDHISPKLHELPLLNGDLQFAAAEGAEGVLCLAELRELPIQLFVCSLEVKSGQGVSRVTHDAPRSLRVVTPIIVFLLRYVQTQIVIVADPVTKLNTSSAFVTLVGFELQSKFLLSIRLTSLFIDDFSIPSEHVDTFSY